MGEERLPGRRASSFRVRRQSGSGPVSLFNFRGSVRMDGNGPFKRLAPPGDGGVVGQSPEEWCGLVQDKGKRVYQLAKELAVESKELLDYCKELGYDIKNQLSALTGDQVSAVMARAKQGPQGGVAVAVAPSPPVLTGKLGSKVRTLNLRGSSARLSDSRQGTAVAEPAVEPPPPAVVVTPPLEPVIMPALSRPSDHPAPVIPVDVPVVTPAAQRPSTPPTPTGPPAPAASANPSRATPAPSAPSRPSAHGPLRNLGGSPRPGDSAGGGTPTRRSPLIGQRRGSSASGFTYRDPKAHAPPSLRNQQTPKPAAPKGPQKLANIPQHLMDSGKPITVKDVMDAHRAPPGGGAAIAPAPDVSDEEGEGEKGKGKVRPGGVTGRETRRIGRDLRAREKKSVGVQVQGGRVMVVEDERENRACRGGKLRPKIKRPGTIEPQGQGSRDAADDRPGILRSHRLGRR